MDNFLQLDQLFLPLLIAIPFMTAILLLLVKNDFYSWLIASFTTLLLLLISVYFLFTTVDLPIYYSMGNFVQPFGIELKLDRINLFFLLITTIISFTTVLWSRISIKNELITNRPNIFYALFILAIAGIIGIVITNDAFNLFVFIEISSLPVYAIIALSKDKHAPLFSFNYLLIGTVSASFYMFGIGFLYLLFGTLNIDGISSALVKYPFTPALKLSLIMITVALLIKSALYPLFWWLPNTYSRSPSALSAFLAGSSTKVSFYIFIKIIIIMFGSSTKINFNYLFDLLLILSLFSVFIGGYLALKQSSLKMLFSYSSVAQLGFIFIGIGIYNSITLSASLFILLSHAFTKAALFMCLGSLMLFIKKDNIINFQGIGHKHPVLFICLIYLILTLAGFPGTSGFWGKLYLIIGVFKSAYWYIAIPVIISTLFSFYYAWKVIETMWINEDSVTHTQYKSRSLPFYAYISLFILVSINIALTLKPDLFFYEIENIIFRNILKG